MLNRLGRIKPGRSEFILVTRGQGLGLGDQAV